MEAINKAVLSYNQYHLPMNKGDDWRTKALSKEIDKIDQVMYKLINSLIDHILARLNSVWLQKFNY